MNIETYLREYGAFLVEFCPDATLEDHRSKVLEEIIEYLEACENETNERQLDEAIDLMNALIKFIHLSGVPNPLWAGFTKLELTAEKYRKRIHMHPSYPGNCGCTNFISTDAKHVNCPECRHE